MTARFVGSWQRQEPLVYSAEVDGGDCQVTGAWGVRWARQLSDGTYALVDEVYYGVKVDGSYRMERQTEYRICRNLDDPGSSEICSDGDWWRGSIICEMREAYARVAAEGAFEPSHDTCKRFERWGVAR